MSRRPATSQSRSTSRPRPGMQARQTRTKTRKPVIPTSRRRERTVAVAMGRRAPPPRRPLSDSASRAESTRRLRTRATKRSAGPGVVRRVLPPRAGTVTATSRVVRRSTGAEAWMWREPMTPICTSPSGLDQVLESVAASSMPSRWMRAVSTWCGCTLPNRTGELRVDQKVTLDDGSSP